MRTLQLYTKHTFDFIIASLLLIALSAILILIGLGVWLGDRGPIFYSHPRLGKNTKLFTIYKFRSMKMGSEYLADTLPANDRDPRLTTFGRFIRAWSLDELPQLWNVLKGDMSLVGPRPRNSDDPPLNQYSAKKMLRFMVRPGITGLAQINGRNQLSWQDMMALDVRYVQEFSLWLDIKILGLTLWKVLKREGIYHA
ncbi:MAG: sugar transferase [Gammaproteobacteria bacterium]|nr:sugar transferase [Gammaproteobacteria bacterium]